jgi:hypothetical protein
VLEAWVKEARSLAKDVGREDIADDRIGQMLSASPVGADGNWPAEPVREVLDLFRSKPMLDGFQTGKRNRRGVTTRAPRDGGEQERALSAQYRAWAKAVSFEHPHTAKALDGLGPSFRLCTLKVRARNAAKPAPQRDGYQGRECSGLR